MLIDRESEISSLSRLLTLVGLVVVIAGLYFGRPVLVPLALAVGFAFLLAPVVTALEKFHLGRIPSVLIVLFVSFALLAAVGWAVSRQLVEILVDLPDYKANIHRKIAAIRSPGTGSLSKATTSVNDLSKELSAASEAAGNPRAGKSGGKEPIAVQVAAPPRDSTEYLRDVAGPLTGVLETTVIVVVFTLFILVKREDLRNRVFRLAGSDRLNVLTQALDEASQRLGRYVFLQIIVNIGYGLLFGLGVYAIGIPHPLLWGVVGCLLRFIPYIGTAIAAALPMALALAVFPGWSQVALTFALFLGLELTIGNVLEPWLYGTHTGVSSMAILVAAIFWGMLWGPVGLILSTPLTVCLILLGKYSPQLGFLDILLGDEPVLSPQAHFYQRLLALDDEEARDIAQTFLKDYPLGHLYDSVLLPALSLSEHDRHRNALDETRTNFIHQSTRELIEEFYEVSQRQESAGADSLPAVELTGRRPMGSKVACIPARDVADEIVGTMASHLLREAGYDAHALPVGPLSAMLDQIEQMNADIICVSALPPSALGQARIVCKRVLQRWPKVKLFLGLWEFPGGVAKAKEKLNLMNANAPLIGTSLIEIVSLIKELNLHATSPAHGATEAAEDEDATVSPSGIAP